MPRTVVPPLLDLGYLRDEKGRGPGHAELDGPWVISLVGDDLVNVVVDQGRFKAGGPPCDPVAVDRQASGAPAAYYR